jgi:choline dehydrogenase-like flavoprotein
MPLPAVEAHPRPGDLVRRSVRRRRRGERPGRRGCRPRAGLSGTLTRRGGVAKPLTTADRAVFARGTAEARAIVRLAGGKSVYVAGHVVAVHPGGTAKLGDFVDTDLPTEIRGLYVGDASVIPVEWGLPPTFTVPALGPGLGRRLAGVGADAPARAG